MPRLPLNDQSLLGTWCEYRPLSIGNLVTDEFTFSANHRYVWRRMELLEDDDIRFVRNEGAWQLAGDLLQLSIEQNERPELSPFRRIHFRARMRDNDGRRQLVLQCALYDDQNQENRHGLCVFPREAAPGEADENHNRYREKRKRPIAIDGPYKQLVSMLVKAIPPAVAALRLPNPVFCVRLYFHDTHAPREGYRGWVRCLTEPARQRVLKQERPIDVPDALWHATSGIANDDPALDNGLFEAELTSSAELLGAYSEIYDRLSTSEEENILKLRAALRQVSLTLHMVKWPENVNLTDDFVVFPADGSNFFAGEFEQDMKASIPKRRLDLLAERGYL